MVKEQRITKVLARVIFMVKLHQRYFWKNQNIFLGGRKERYFPSSEVK